MHRSLRALTSFFTYACYFGLFVLVAGYFLTNEDSRYHTQLYIGLHLPVAILLVLAIKPIFRDWLADPALQGFTAVLAWFGVTTLWTTYQDVPHLLKLLFMLGSLALVLRLLLDNLRSFNISVSIAAAVVAVASIWTVAKYSGAVGADFYAHRLDFLGKRDLNPILVGVIGSILMMYCLIMYRMVNKQPLKAGYLLLSLIFATIIVLSFSRTAFIALLVTVFCYQLFVGNYKFAAAASLVIALLLGLMIADFEQNWLVNISRSLTLDIRFWGWRQTLEKISEHWILGYGLRTDLEVSWVGTPYEASPPDWFHPHNLFLEVWYQTGVIGLLLTLYMLGLVARKIHQLWYAVEIRYFSCILVFVLVACLVDRPVLVDRPTHSWLWFWLPIMVALNADKLLMDRNSEHR